MASIILKAPELHWQEEQHPHSILFDDHYYSLVNGLEETKHVFIEGNDLLSRWNKLPSQAEFCIFETGFGSGINFLSTWTLWKSHNFGKNKQLNYISVEAYPMSKQQLKRSLLNWMDSLSEVTLELLDNYPDLTSGVHLFRLSANVTLTLIFDDIKSALSVVSCPEIGLVDAWYLDGFAPSKNPQMWNEHLYSQMNRLSKSHATVATYTVAGVVRRGLNDAEFTIERKPGFGTKREMLTAQFKTRPIG